MDDEHVLALIEAVDRAHLDAVHVFAFDAVFVDDIGHGVSVSFGLASPIARPYGLCSTFCNASAIGRFYRLIEELRLRGWPPPFADVANPDHADIVAQRNGENIARRHVLRWLGDLDAVEANLTLDDEARRQRP
jgi:hypothetical protein